VLSFLIRASTAFCRAFVLVFSVVTPSPLGLEVAQVLGCGFATAFFQSLLPYDGLLFKGLWFGFSAG
jgi:hypothetical protein